MKRPWILIIIGAFAFLIFMFSYRDTDENFLPIYEKDDLYDEAMLASGYDANDFTPYQSYVIYNQPNLSYVKSFHEEDYTGISVNPIVFERDWGESSFVAWDETLTLDTHVTLFETENRYLIILTFERPYTYSTTQNHIGYIDVRYSNNFQINTSVQISYIDDDNEYVLYSAAVYASSDNGMMPIVQNTKAINDIFKPHLIYTYIINVTPTDDNDLDIDMYLGMDIDIYMLDANANQSVQIGFNEFKLSKQRFLVTRKSVQYRREINQ